jgi:hypothetical protein
VLFNRRAVLAAVSFSKLTSADLVSPSAVTLMSVIFPLERGRWRVSHELTRVAGVQLGYLPEAEEVLDLAIAGRGSDVGNVNTVGSHSDE